MPGLSFLSCLYHFISCLRFSSPMYLYFYLDVILSLQTQHVESPGSSHFQHVSLTIVLFILFLCSLLLVVKNYASFIWHAFWFYFISFPISLSLVESASNLLADCLPGLKVVPVPYPICYSEVCQIDLPEFCFLLHHVFFFSLKLTAAPCF